MPRIWCFQSIGVANEWRRTLFLFCVIKSRRFQSIGVANEWRLVDYVVSNLQRNYNSFQSISVANEWRLKEPSSQPIPEMRQFPINRCRQRVATCVQVTGFMPNVDKVYNQ